MILEKVETGSALAPMPPAMTQAEQALLRAAAAGAPRAMEFGCGGSTALLLDAGVEALLSVDSDAAWLGRVAGQHTAAMAQGRLRQWHAQIGPVGEWGWPLRPPGPLEGWLYWGAPWSDMAQVDVVLVDGRFRIACALAAHGRLAAEGVLAIHDFWPRRAYQDALKPFFHVIGSAGSMALMQPVPVVQAALLTAQQRHAADAR